MLGVGVDINSSGGSSGGSGS